MHITGLNKDKFMSHLNVKQDYKTLRNEVSKVAKKILSFTETCRRADEIYKGCQILFSQLIYKPEIMFIGINPGAGYWDCYGKRVDKLDPQPQLEYLDDTYVDCKYGKDQVNNYPLARQTLKVFEMAGKEKLLRNAVKSNYLYFATMNKKEFNELNRLLEQAGTLQNIADLADDWTRRIIDMIKPKVIICEGKMVFDWVWELVMGKPSANWKKEHAIAANADGLCLVGYKRIGSNIRDKRRLAAILKDQL